MGRADCDVLKGPSSVAGGAFFHPGPFGRQARLDLPQGQPFVVAGVSLGQGSAAYLESIPGMWNRFQVPGWLGLDPALLGRPLPRTSAARLREHERRTAAAQRPMSKVTRRPA